MQSKAKTVPEYLAELPEDRRVAITAVRKVILANLDRDYEEGMHYGMIGYCVPHRVFPAGYHCDPEQPLPFAGLASQKNHMALYLMTVYGHGGEGTWFRDAWKKSGKKLDMGKSCIRFRKLEDVALDVIGEAIRRVPARKYVEFYESTIRTSGAAKRSRSAKPGAKAAGKKAPPAKSAKHPGKKSARRKT